MKEYMKLYMVLLWIGLFPIEMTADNISLNGSWNLKFFPQPRHAVTSPKELANVNVQQIEATVPGNVELDMLKAGLIADPMIGNNVYSLRKYEGYQWCYTKKFKSPQVKKDEQVQLFFGGIDCIAEVWLNGKHLGSVSNMFIEYTFDVTDLLLKDAENILQVMIRSAVMEAQKYTLGTFSIGNFAAAESTYIRKAPHSYGWDIMPRLVSAGLWRDVELKIINNTHIVNTHWMTSSIDLKDNTAQLFVDVQLAIPFEKLDKTNAKITLKRKIRLFMRVQY
jgi:Beta-galactosidase/beta-glucuronidase